MEDLLAEYPVIVECPVIWGDMDAYQHVNNTVYFRYFETVRISFFDRIGFEEVKNETGIGPILASTQCRFRLPLTYPDTVSIGARLIDVLEDRLTMLYRVVSHNHKKIAAEGDGLLMAYDYKGMRRASFPALVRERILEIA